VRAAAPDQGVHTAEVLREFGYSAAAIEGLKQRGVI
jgi:crotonobetainyl-CoA:carnitine CoA-transferase CaiB-like acyl-CoA transferase